MHIFMLKLIGNHKLAKEFEPGKTTEDPYFKRLRTTIKSTTTQKSVDSSHEQRERDALLDTILLTRHTFAEIDRLNKNPYPNFVLESLFSTSRTEEPAISNNENKAKKEFTDTLLNFKRLSDEIDRQNPNNNNNNYNDNKEFDRIFNELVKSNHNE
ncbi:hypothetical protein PVAND_011222 [Polypedilum vanderplanki]|uniref:Uncharacterized protein n=1 Tax=Polypedilum vanderplanki TaxID=319348 RepID=A0A9J6CJR1_POLVA|nr:hypothetical protein PVAND_011222 [Polypedilum vanderplanki]